MMTAADVLTRAFQLLYFMAPAYVANMAAPLTRYWRGWNRPISTRWFGGHKTAIGFVAGVLGALGTSFLQYAIDHGARIVDGDNWVDLGLRFGLGAMVGDCAKSFFKRRLKIPPGRPWLPFDQIDFVLGALVLLMPRATFDPGDIALVLGLSFGGHIAVNHVA
jgi:CDP-2,3-bis-(O-geranylgeranyl)-sn-glycerol synthase